MALATVSFWEEFFSQRQTPADPTLPSEASEWYLDSNGAYMVLVKKLKTRDRRYTAIFHSGCGSSELGVILSTVGGFRKVI